MLKAGRGEAMGGALVGGLFFLLLGTGMSVWGWRGYLEQRRGMAAARTWREATAVVDSVGIHTIERRTLGLLFMLTQGRTILMYLFDPKGPRHSGANTYEPQVRYRFQANGQTYHGSRIAFGTLKRNFIIEAKRLIAPYTPGQWVKVRYNPYDPRDCVIEAKAYGSYLGIAIIGVFALLFGLMFFFLIATGKVR